MSCRLASLLGSPTALLCMIMLSASCASPEAGADDVPVLQLARQLASPINDSSQPVQAAESDDSIAIEIEEPGAGISFMSPGTGNRPAQAIRIGPILSSWNHTGNASPQGSLGPHELRVHQFDSCSRGGNCTSAGLRLDGDLVVAGRIVTPTVDALVEALDATRVELASARQELTDLKAHRLAKSTIQSVGVQANRVRLASFTEAGTTELDGALYLTGVEQYEADLHPLNSSATLPASKSLAIETATGESVAYKGMAFFSASTATTGNELWSWSATQGLGLAQDIYPGPSPSNPVQLTVTPGGLFFVATGVSVGNELWHWDNSLQVAQVVSDSIRSGSSSSNPSQLVASDLELFFVASDTSNRQRVYRYSWVTRDRPSLIGSALPGGSTSDNWSPRNMMMVGQDLIFTATTSSVPFLFNSTENKITPLASSASTVYSASRFVATSNGYLMFQGYRSSTGLELWRYDIANNRLMFFDWTPKESPTSFSNMFAVGPNIFFSAYLSLQWQTFRHKPGTGTLLAIRREYDGADLGPPTETALIGTTLALIASTSSTGRALFCVVDADSSLATTTAKHVPGITVSSPSALRVVSGRLAIRAEVANGQAAWWSMNSTCGDLRQESNTFPQQNSRFFLDDGVNRAGLSWRSDWIWLWKYTPVDGLQRVPQAFEYEGVYIYPSATAVLERELVLLDNWNCNNICCGSTLWTYAPGDPRGLQLVSCSDSEGGSQALVVYEDWVYMNQYKQASGTELYRMQRGKSPELAADIAPGRDSSDPQPLAVYEGSLFVFARRAASNFFQLWSITHQPGNSSAPPAIEIVAQTLFSSSGYPFAAISSDIGLVFIQQTPIHGRELFIYSPTDGLEVLEDLYPAGSSSSPSYLTLLGNSILFTAYDSSGLWKLWMMEPGGGVTQVGNRQFSSSVERPMAIERLGDRVMLLTMDSRSYSSGRVWEAQPGQPLRLASSRGRIRPGVKSVKAIFPYNGTAVALVASGGVGFAMELLKS